MSDGVISTILVVVSLVIIVCGVIYINDHVTCTNLGGLIKGACAIK